MTNDEINELVSALGWIDLPSKNPYMVSYKNEDYGSRMNIYFTTGTVQIQNEDGSFEIHRSIHSIGLLENILTEYAK